MLNTASIKHFLFSPDSWLWRPNRSLLYWITTIVLALAVAQTLWDLIGFNYYYHVRYSVNTNKLEGPTISPGAPIFTHANGELLTPSLQQQLPAGVRFEGSLPVYVEIDRTTLMSQILLRVRSVPIDLLALLGIWLFRRVALTAVGTPDEPANPFVWANVRRLRVLAAVVIVGPLVNSWSEMATLELVAGTLKEFSMMTFDLGTFFPAAASGIVLALLAEVFASGIRLREDVEGLV